MVRKYNKETDFESIKQWGKEWGAEYQEDLFPSLGFIYPGIAAYFIYTGGDSKVCWLENMVCNKAVSKELREQALQLIVTETLKEVNRLGFKVAYATTNNKAVIDRATLHKANITEEQTLLTLKFNN